MIRRHTRWPRDWSSDVCSSDLQCRVLQRQVHHRRQWESFVPRQTSLLGWVSYRDSKPHYDASSSKNLVVRTDDVEIGRASCRKRVEKDVRAENGRNNERTNVHK